VKDFAAAEWTRALRTLASARQLVETDGDSAASRAYYAAFHALTALFALRGKSFSRHTALRAALHRDLIRDGDWASELGQAFDFLIELRETGDYGGLTQVPADGASKAVHKAQEIIAAVKRSCPQLHREGL